MKNRILAASAALMMTATLLAGCGRELTAVYVQTVNEIMGYGTAGESNVCAGIIVAQNEVKIEKDSNRKVLELKVEAGQNVNQGDTLFVYDTDEIELTIDKSELEIEQLKNTVTDAKNQIAELEKEKKKAPESEQLSYTVQIQSLEASMKETEYNITVKQRELDNLKSTVGTGEVTSPITGRVKSVNADGSSDPNTGELLPYITLIEEGAYRVKGKVNEMNHDDFSVGQTVTVRSRVNPEQTWFGTIAEIDSSPENNNNNGMYYYGSTDQTTTSSSYPFYVNLDNTDNLLLGQHVYIEPSYGETPEGLYLSGSYVLGTDKDGYYVWAANSHDEIEKRTVTVGNYDEIRNAYEITDGLSGEDRIAFPDENVKEGAPVTEVAPTEENSGDNDESAQDGLIDGNPVDGGDSFDESGFNDYDGGIADSNFINTDMFDDTSDGGEE